MASLSTSPFSLGLKDSLLLPFLQLTKIDHYNTFSVTMKRKNNLIDFINGRECPVRGKNWQRNIIHRISLRGAVDYIRRLIEAYELWWLNISNTEIRRDTTAVIHSNTCMCHCIDLTVDPGTQAEEFANNEIK